MLTVTLDEDAYRLAARHLEMSDELLDPDGNVDDLVVAGLCDDLANAASNEALTLFGVTGLPSPVTGVDVSVAIDVGHSNDGSYDGLYADARLSWVLDGYQSIAVHTPHSYVRAAEIGGTDLPLDTADRLVEYLRQVVADLNYYFAFTERAWTQLVTTTTKAA